MPDLSVIIPVYNTEKYLEQCIVSALPQKGQNIELILVDDGSTDNSSVLCDDFQTKYPEIVRVIHKANGGLSDARNAGIEKAKGKYLMFLDSDDMFASGLYDWILGLLNFGYDIIEFDFFYCKDRNRISPKFSSKCKTLSASDEIIRLLKNKVGDQIGRRAYKRSLFKDIRFPTGKTYEDMFTYYRIVLNSQSILTSNSQYYIYYLSNSESITHTFNEKNLESMFEAVNAKCKGVSQFCADNRISKDYIEYYRRFEYAYIYHKLKKYNICSGLVDYIRDYLSNNNHYNFVRNKGFIFNSPTLLKTWVYYEINHLFNRM
jgi:glycosyltransferase involved in cell wall biosynthesis